MPFTGAPNEYLRSLAKNSLLRQEMHPWLADTDERREGLDEAARAFWQLVTTFPVSATLSIGQTWQR